MKKKINKKEFNEIILKDALYSLEEEHGLHKNSDESYKDFKKFVKSKKRISSSEVQENLRPSILDSIISLNAGLTHNMLMGYFVASIFVFIYLLNNSNKTLQPEELIFRSSNAIIVQVANKDKEIIDYLNHLNSLGINYKLNKDKVNYELTISYTENIDSFLLEKNIEPILDKHDKFLLIIKD